MSRLRLSFACKDYDLVTALKEGYVAPEGIELVFVTSPFPHKTFSRQLRYAEWDVCEMSLASYLFSREHDSSFVAVPVFPVRKFRHSYLYTQSHSDINNLEDLVGKKVGIPEYYLTAAIWVRGLLKEEYRVDWKDIMWFTEREERVSLGPPAGVRLERISRNETLENYLVDRRVDAYFSPSVIPTIKHRDARVRRVLADWRTAEMDYFRRTGFFPIMHTIVMKEQLYKEHPWVAMSLFHAFEQSKRVAYQRFDDTQHLTLVWIRWLYEEQLSLMGADPFPYGLAKNRETLAKIAEYAFDQGLTQRKVKPEEVFAETTLET